MSIIEGAIETHKGRGRPKGADINTSGESNSSDPPKIEPIKVPKEVLRELKDTFQLLSDQTRLKILIYLFRYHELHVRALCELLGQSQPAVSHHLALLKARRLIDNRREGKHNFYSVQPEKFQQLVQMVFSTVPEARDHITQPETDSTDGQPEAENPPIDRIPHP